MCLEIKLFLEVPLCETNRLCVHAHSPLGVGACVPCSLSQTDAPSLPPRYQRSQLLWAPPTSFHHRFRPCCLGLSGSAQYSAPVKGSPGLLHILSVMLEAAFDPGWSQPVRLYTGYAVACWRLDTIGPFQRGHFGTQHLHGRHYPLPLLLACFRAYASNTVLPPHLQGSIPGPWLAVTGAGFSPARICSLAQPQPRPDTRASTLLLQL
jgi:hypothetical protein